MASIASGLFKSLPKPKYTGEEEELPQHAQPRGPRVVGADQLDETQVVLRVSFLFGPPCYFNSSTD
jgi:SNW domain-containing protein 1